MGLGIIGSALISGGAGAALKGIEENDKFAQESSLVTQRSDAELGRQKTILLLQQQAKDGPLNRLSAKAASYADTEKPLEAAPVTADTNLSGVYASDQGPSNDGATGPVGIIQSAIAKMPAGPERDAAVERLQVQVKDAQGMNAAEAVGKTRKLTKEEQLQAAVEDARVNDLPAAAAYETALGAPARADRKLENDERKAENLTRAQAAETARKEKVDDRRYELDLKRADLQSSNLDAQNRKTDALIEHWANQDDAKANAAGKAGTPERMGSIINAMNATIKNLDDNRPRSSDDQATRDDWAKQKKNAIQVRDRATAKLNANFGDDSAPAGYVPRPGVGTSSNRAPAAAAAAYKAGQNY